MTPVKETLIAARAKIADPKHWTQNYLAHDISGRPISPYSPNAVCWCALGAIESVSRGRIGPAVMTLSSVIEGPVSQFNDTHTHAEILAAFDRAIEGATQ